MLARGVLAFHASSLLLIGLTLACGAPTPAAQGDPSQTLANARATDVRRTAVADVQRIIANNPPATPTAPATAIERPSCPNAIWWHEARAHLGEMRAVQGTIVGTRNTADGGLLLELGQPYPDPTGVAVLLQPPATTAAGLAGGKSVCVLGRLEAAEGRPTMLVRDRASITLID